MLRITVPGTESFDEEKNEFTTVGDFDLELEHSLVSLSKWESKHQKPFLNQGDKTEAETISYIEMMILTEDYPENFYELLSVENANQIQAYIESDQSATTFGELPRRRGRGEIITSELIYYWMVAFTIPFEAEAWHLNRLFSLIRICNIKNDPKAKKMPRSEVQRRNRELNEKRKAELGTRG